MSMSASMARKGDADVQKKSAANEAAASPRNVQLKQALQGKGFAEQEAALAPVQMAGGSYGGGKGGSWNLSELGTGEAESEQQEEPTKRAPMGPSVEQIVADAYTLGGKERYQVTPDKAIKWVEDQMRGAKPEHKYAFQEAIKKINKRL